MPSVGQEHGASLLPGTVKKEKEMPCFGGNTEPQERVGKAGQRGLIPVPVEGQDDAAVDAESDLCAGAVTDESFPFHRGGPAESELYGGGVSGCYPGGEPERAVEMPVRSGRGVRGGAGEGGRAPAGGALGWGGRGLVPCVDRRW